MHRKLRKWLLFTFLLVLLIFPFSVNAQKEIQLDSVNVQLWPEFDQPATLVIYDFTLDENTTLPVNLTFRVPADANLTAIAYAPTGSNLLNANYENSGVEGDWQVFTFLVDTVATYHIEFYAPLNFDGQERNYTYIWPGDYATKSFDLRIKVPVDTTEISTDPSMTETTATDDLQSYLNWNSNDLAKDEQVSFKINYTKTSDRLSMSEQPIETGAVDENTQGRVSINNYLPYILGGLGFLLIAAGGYFWQTSQGRPVPRKRHNRRSQDNGDGDVYCHQCGKRAQSGDRFCRTCGTRLRKET